MKLRAQLMVVAAVALATAVTACHLIFPYTPEDIDGGGGDADIDAGAPDLLPAGRMTLLEESFDTNTLGARWLLSPAPAMPRHQVTDRRLELWTPSAAPPYHGSTIGKRLVDTLPTGTGKITLLATFRWQAKTTSPLSTGLLSIGVTGTTQIALQVHRSKGKIFARFGTRNAELKAGIWYKLVLTIDSSEATAHIYHAATFSTVFEHKQSHAGSTKGLNTFRIEVTTNKTQPDEVRVSLDDVLIVEDTKALQP